MTTFDARLSGGSFWSAVLVPPTMFFVTVQLVDSAMLRGRLGIEGLVLLIALAQILPLLALVWTLFSAAAYSIEPGKLTVHRIISDREISLRDSEVPPRLEKDVITLRLRTHSEISLRVEQPRECFSVLQSALAAQP